MKATHIALAGAAIAGGIAIAYTTRPGQDDYALTTECRAVPIDNLAVEAAEAIDRLRWRYPAERIVIDEADGSVRILPVALVPPPCNTRTQEDEALVIGR